MWSTFSEILMSNFFVVRSLDLVHIPWNAIPCRCSHRFDVVKVQQEVRVDHFHCFLHLNIFHIYGNGHQIQNDTNLVSFCKSFKLSLIIKFQLSSNFTDEEKLMFVNGIYDHPLVHVGPYLVGIFYGYFTFNYDKQIRVRPMFLTIGNYRLSPLPNLKVFMPSCPFQVGQQVFPFLHSSWLVPMEWVT